MDVTSTDDDVQIIKVVPCKKPVTWVSSSFDSFGFDSKPTQRPNSNPKAVSQSSITEFTSDVRSLKRLREDVNQPNRQFSSSKSQLSKPAFTRELWSEKYKPVTRADLAVHKKKVDAIADWLDHNSQHVKRHKAPILLLSGPSGAGKTACVHVLCSELGIDLKEWSSSSEQAADQWSDENFTFGEKSKVDVYMSQSQSSVFHNFLLRANRYNALNLIGPVASTDMIIPGSPWKKTVVVVEEIPNIFFRDTHQFHDILRKYHYSGHCPLVFIMSESNSSSCGIQKLFPKDLQSSLNITNISLNPVPPTVLTKLLNGIISREARQGRFSLPNIAVVEAVAVSSSGDIRAAINTLQFASRSDTSDLKALCPASVAAKRKKDSSSRVKRKPVCDSKRDTVHSENTHSLLGAKDTSVFLFHAVGKILYFKRGDPKEYPQHQHLPPHLKEHDRDPLLCNPEEVAQKSHLSGDYFNSFLHENYVDFLSTVEDLERATNYFSDADYLSALWVAREELQNYAVSVATRGYIHSCSEFCRHDSSRKMSWRPLHKSRWFSVSKQASENIATARQLFKGYHWEPEILCTEILPFISLANPTLHDAGQISFVQEMTQFSQHKPLFRLQEERLDERDIITEEEVESTNRESHSGQSSSAHPTDINTEDENDEKIPCSSQTKIQDLNCEDEIVIEDFDDD